MTQPPILVLLRHGESEWNKKNLFTGWVDIPLSQRGIQEALQAGAQLAEISFAVIFTSALIRAQMTAMLAMSVHRGGKVPCFHHPAGSVEEKWGKVYSPEALASCIPVFASSALNERMYGELQGLNKEETKKKFGDAQVQQWRRSYRTAPPQGESLATNAQRTLPYVDREILPWVRQQSENVLVVAHGNSLRAIVMRLENMTEEEILHFEIPCGVPLIYEWTGSWRRRPA